MQLEDYIRTCRAAVHHDVLKLILEFRHLCLCNLRELVIFVSFAAVIQADGCAPALVTDARVQRGRVDLLLQCSATIRLIILSSANSELGL